ncbi:MAG: transposase domain-containing protein [Metallibacterium sp.]
MKRLTDPMQSLIVTCRLHGIDPYAYQVRGR